MKHWLMERFLPMWAKETLWRDYRALRRENARLRRTLEQKDAYIKGMHSVLARTRKVKMDNGERPDRCQWQRKGGERVAAVDKIEEKA
jgi:hypothetical protein